MVESADVPVPCRCEIHRHAGTVALQQHAERRSARRCSGSGVPSATPGSTVRAVRRISRSLFPRSRVISTPRAKTGLCESVRIERGDRISVSFPMEIRKMTVNECGTFDRGNSQSSGSDCLLCRRSGSSRAFGHRNGSLVE